LRGLRSLNLMQLQLIGQIERIATQLAGWGEGSSAGGSAVRRARRRSR
jgi:hypothetical protein